MKNKTALATVIYPGVEKYLRYFLNSVASQSHKEFDLIVCNNQMKLINDILEGYFLSFKIINVKESATLARVKLIEFLKKNKYDYVIFADADDVIDQDRVKLTIQYLQKNTIIVNDFNLIDENNNKLIKNYLSNRIKNNEKIYSRSIKHHNFMGLTNTAVRLNCINLNIIPKNPNILAYDWFLWSKVLEKNNTGIFCSNIKTNYRIYNNNIASLSSKLDNNEIIKGIKAKLHHYKELSTDNKEFNCLHNKIEIMYKNLENNNWILKYKEFINRKNILFPFWWEKISIME